MQCSAQGQLTDAFPVRTGVRQCCLLSPFVFFLVIDWIVKHSASQKKEMEYGGQLGDLDFADDLASPVPHPTADATKNK